MAIDLYFMRFSPPSRAVLMTTKQLNIEVNIKPIDLGKGQHLTPEFLKLNPGHTVPTIVDNHFVLFESRAIMQYLCNKYAPESQLYPKNPEKRAIVDRWLNIDSSFLMACRHALIRKLFFGLQPTENQIEDFRNIMKVMDTLIDDNKYLASDHLTIADLSVLATTTILSINDYQDLNHYPNMKKWFQTLSSELPYFEDINGRAGEDFKELATYIKPGH